MKYLLILLFPTIMVSSEESSCTSDEWMFTNTTVKWPKSDTKFISTKATTPEKNDQTNIYEDTIAMDDCTDEANCMGEPKVTVNNIDCDNLMNDDDVTLYGEACKVAQKAAKWETEKQWLTDSKSNAQTLYDSQHCMGPDDINSSN